MPPGTSESDACVRREWVASILAVVKKKSKSSYSQLQLVEAVTRVPVQARTMLLSGSSLRSILKMQGDEICGADDADRKM